MVGIRNGRRQVALHAAVEQLEIRRLMAVSLMYADFENGGAASNDGFTFSPASPNLWHVTALRYQSPGHSLYYGQDSTQNYDTGAANSGSALSPSISLVPSSTSPPNRTSTVQLTSRAALSRSLKAESA